MNTTSDRDWIPGRQRVRHALHGLLVLFFALWFGAGAAIFVLVLVAILTGNMQWAVGVPERVLFTALVVLAIVVLWACAIAMGCAACLDLLVAVRGWVPNQTMHPAGSAASRVTLRKADGTEITLPMDRLSQADQEWIKKPHTRGEK